MNRISRVMAITIFTLTITILTCSLAHSTVTIKIPDTFVGCPPDLPEEITATIESDTDLSEIASLNLSLSFAPAENIVVTGVTGLGEFSNWTVIPNPQSDGSGVEIALYGTTTFPDVTSTPKDLIKITFDKHENMECPVVVKISKGTGNTVVGLNDGTTIMSDDIIIADQDGTEDDTDISLPVELSSFTARKANQGVVISWRTETEINNLGFDVYRSEERKGKFVKINSETIKGAGISAEPHEYKFTDEKVEPGHTYYYYLKSIDFSGKQQQSHIIKVTLLSEGEKITTLWGRLKTAD